MFIFHTMVEYLLSTSILIYAKEKNLSVHEKGVAAFFSHFLKTDVFVNAKGLYAKQETTSKAQLKKSVYTYFWKTYVSKAGGMFNDMAKLRPGLSLKDSTTDKTMTIRELLLKLKVYFHFLFNLSSLIT